VALITDGIQHAHGSPFWGQSTNLGCHKYWYLHANKMVVILEQGFIFKFKPANWTLMKFTYPFIPSLNQQATLYHHHCHHC